jgi:hypothetical protein
MCKHTLISAITTHIDHQDLEFASVLNKAIQSKLHSWMNPTIPVIVGGATVGFVRDSYIAGTTLFIRCAIEDLCREDTKGLVAVFYITTEGKFEVLLKAKEVFNVHGLPVPSI